eukprot:Awhi_evm1s14938
MMKFFVTTISACLIASTHAETLCQYFNNKSVQVGPTSQLLGGKMVKVCCLNAETELSVDCCLNSCSILELGISDYSACLQKNCEPVSPQQEAPVQVSPTQDVKTESSMETSVETSSVESSIVKSESSTSTSTSQTVSVSGTVCRVEQGSSCENDVEVAPGISGGISIGCGGKNYKVCGVLSRVNGDIDCDVIPVCTEGDLVAQSVNNGNDNDGIAYQSSIIVCTVALLSRQLL